MSQRPLEGEVAVVTGAVRRLGKAMAMELAEDGAAVVINARSSREEADATAAEINAKGGRAIVHLADVTDEAAVKGLMDATVKAFGKVSILINNAAVRSDIPFLQMSLADWHRVTGVILDGAFLCSRYAVPHMMTNGWGRIINIGGVSAHVGAPDRAHVLTGKSGLTGFTRALAIEFAKHNITANCVVPGRIGGHRSATSGKGIAGMPPVGREGYAEDVSAMVRLLCQKQTSYVTGQTIHINGGMFLP